MKKYFNHFIINIIPFLPLSFVRLFASKYVAGESKDDALKVVSSLNDKGFMVTVDILGEHANNISHAQNITNEYKDLLIAIHAQGLNCNLSIKPSHIGMDLNADSLNNNLKELLDCALQYGNFIRLDMEDSSLTDQTIHLYKYFKHNYNNIGLVFQAYLYRTMEDLELFSNEKDFNIRLCKGIYKEDSTIAMQDRSKINTNYLQLIEYAFTNNLYIGIATHDIYILKKVYKMINNLKVNADRFEFQVLYGVPMSGWLERHLKNGYKVRIYVPFGKDWYEYSLRRLKENPDILNYILKDLFRRK